MSGKIRLMSSLTALAVATLFLGASSASAITIDCATAGCIGGVYDLEVSSLGGDSYQAIYTVDTSVSYDVAATSLVEVEFKVSNDYSSLSVLSGPSGNLFAGPLAGMGCGGTNDTFVCLDLDPDQPLGSTYSWTVQFDSSTGILEESEWHIGARYTSETQTTGWVISETGYTTPVPEPGAATLYAAALVAIGSFTRRKA